jgi:hypothetical protein
MGFGQTSLSSVRRGFMLPQLKKKKSINQPLFLQKSKPSYPNPKYFFGIQI